MIDITDQSQLQNDKTSCQAESSYKQCLRCINLSYKNFRLGGVSSFSFNMRINKILSHITTTFTLLANGSTDAKSCRLCNRMTPAQCASQPLSTCPNQDNEDDACLLEYEQRLERNGESTLFFSSRCVTQNVCQSAVRLGLFYLSTTF